MNKNESLIHAMATFVVGSILLLAIALLSGCKTYKCMPERIEVEKEVIITKHDSIITTRPDSASALALLHCNSLNQVVMDELYTANGERINLSAKLKQLQGNMAALDVRCNEDSLQQRIEWLETELREKQTKTIVKTERYVPLIYKLCAWACACVLIILIIYVTFRVIRFIYIHK